MPRVSDVYRAEGTPYEQYQPNLAYIRNNPNLAYIGNRREYVQWRGVKVVLVNRFIATYDAKPLCPVLLWVEPCLRVCQIS